MSMKEFVQKLDEIQASFSSHFPLVIINSNYKIDNGIVIFGKKGWLRINESVPIMINYGSLILLDTPKNYMVGVYKNVNGGRKIKSYSPSRSQKALNNPSKIRTKQTNNDTTIQQSNNTTSTNTKPSSNTNTQQ
ncbi:hypothetical protein [Acidianus bottle-shaped virus]|uniref:Uncharacterized protein ORF133 n=1 Tax=Acidianus bottle-shaped virus (isolate Italy/Pozzuoli) TaxID=654911 RepID=Y133_ABVP|nr:hypothetical protein ABV_gp56 [Acidianus bottle-shaped virus]A4ZUE2.1 RecName: Full=Uncharacterized protein ORF133 [Acidianus bottle-shaped virus (isolate Pozzuoli)]ABP73446.1 hypothetical protein [Acidianus bottle-shaped virus]